MLLKLSATRCVLSGRSYTVVMETVCFLSHVTTFETDFIQRLQVHHTLCALGQLSVNVHSGSYHQSVSCEMSPGVFLQAHLAQSLRNLSLRLSAGRSWLHRGLLFSHLPFVTGQSCPISSRQAGTSPPSDSGSSCCIKVCKLCGFSFCTKGFALSSGSTFPVLP